MRFRIHFTSRNGDSDSVVVEGGSINQVQELANAEILKRDGLDPWSEELSSDD